MCAIGREQTTSIGAGIGAGTLLGSAPTGGSTSTGARRTSGGASRTTYLGAPPSTPPTRPGWTPGRPPGTFIP